MAVEVGTTAGIGLYFPPGPPVILILALIGLVGLVIFGAVVYLAVRLALAHSRQESAPGARIEVPPPIARTEPGRPEDDRTAV